MSLSSHNFLSQHSGYNLSSRSTDCSTYDTARYMRHLIIEKKIASERLARILGKPVLQYKILVFNSLKNLRMQNARLVKLARIRLLKHMVKLVSLMNKNAKISMSTAFRAIYKHSQISKLPLHYPYRHAGHQDPSAVHQSGREAPIRGRLPSNERAKLVRNKLMDVLAPRIARNLHRTAPLSVFEAFRTLHLTTSLDSFKHMNDHLDFQYQLKHVFAVKRLTRVL